MRGIEYNGLREIYGQLRSKDDLRHRPNEHISLLFCSSKQMAAKSIKEAMDKKFGTFWHVIVGEGFGFEVSYETKNILYLYFGGNLAIVMWKCS